MNLTRFDETGSTDPSLDPALLNYEARMKESFARGINKLEEAKTTEDESPVFDRMPTATDLAKSAYNAPLDLMISEYKRMQEMPIDEMIIENALNMVPLGGTIKRFEKVLAGNNPLKISGKKVGKILYETVNPDDLPKLIKPTVADIGELQKDKLMGAVLRDIADTDDPANAARRLIKAKDLGTQIEYVDDLPHIAGSYNDVLNRIRINNNTTKVDTVLENVKDRASGTLLHEIQHAEDAREIPGIIQSYTQVAYPVTQADLKNIRDNRLAQIIQNNGSRNIPKELTKDKILADYINKNYKIPKGEQLLDPNTYDFNEQKLKYLRYMYNLSPDLYGLDIYQHTNHFLRPKGEIDVAIRQGTQHGLFPTKGVDIHPDWQELTKDLLEKEAEKNKKSIVDFGGTVKQPEESKSKQIITWLKNKGKELITDETGEAGFKQTKTGNILQVVPDKATTETLLPYQQKLVDILSTEIPELKKQNDILFYVQDAIKPGKDSEATDSLFKAIADAKNSGKESIQVLGRDPLNKKDISSYEISIEKAEKLLEQMVK